MAIYNNNNMKTPDGMSHDEVEQQFSDYHSATSDCPCKPSVIVGALWHNWIQETPKQIDE